MKSKEEYKLKSNDFIIDMLCRFGSGYYEFHTADIERLIKESESINTILNLEKEYTRMFDSDVRVAMAILNEIRKINQ